MPNPQGDFIWYELLTDDHAKAKAFYDPVVGWDIEPQSSNPMDYRMIRIRGGGHAGGVMQLNEEMRSHGAHPTWLGYIGVDDVDETVAKAAAAGGKVLMEAFDLPDVGRMALLADPAGAPFYVMRGASDQTSDTFSANAVGHCAWNELVTADLQAAMDFYMPLFGWTAGDSMPMGPMGDYQFILQGGEMIGAMFAPPGRPPTWRFCFRVENLEKSIEAVRSGGGEILFGPTEVPGGGRIIQASDPSGVFFMVIEGGQQ